MTPTDTGRHGTLTPPMFHRVNPYGASVPSPEARVPLDPDEAAS